MRVLPLGRREKVTRIGIPTERTLPPLQFLKFIGFISKAQKLKSYYSEYIWLSSKVKRKNGNLFAIRSETCLRYSTTDPVFGLYRPKMQLPKTIYSRCLFFVDVRWDRLLFRLDKELLVWFTNFTSLDGVQLRFLFFFSQAFCGRTLYNWSNNHIQMFCLSLFLQNATTRIVLGKNCGVHAKRERPQAGVSY